jgi:hypothetical protein
MGSNVKVTQSSNNLRRGVPAQVATESNNNIAKDLVSNIQTPTSEGKLTGVYRQIRFFSTMNSQSFNNNGIIFLLYRYSSTINWETGYYKFSSRKHK